MLVALYMGLATVAYGQSWKGGIVVSEEDQTSITYQFRLVSLDSPIAADRLEDALEAKEGVFNAEASIISKICTTRVIKAIKPRHIAGVVELNGFEIAKSLEVQ